MRITTVGPQAPAAIRPRRLRSTRSLRAPRPRRATTRSRGPPDPVILPLLLGRANSRAALIRPLGPSRPIDAPPSAPGRVDPHRPLRPRRTSPPAVRPVRPSPPGMVTASVSASGGSMRPATRTPALQHRPEERTVLPQATSSARVLHGRVDAAQRTGSRSHAGTAAAPWAPGVCLPPCGALTPRPELVRRMQRPISFMSPLRAAPSGVFHRMWRTRWTTSTGRSAGQKRGRRVGTPGRRG